MAVAGGATPFAKYQGNVTYFIHGNHLGSTTMVFNHTGGTVAQDEIFYPWGERWNYAGTLYDERFAAMQLRDAESGLDPTLFRMYESRLYRWVTPDPVAGDIFNPQSLNRYAYVLNNPVNLIDPLGLDDCTWNPPTLTCPPPPPIPTVPTGSSSSAASSVSQLPLNRFAGLDWIRTISLYIQLERAMAASRERQYALTPERIAALGLWRDEPFDLRLVVRSETCQPSGLQVSYSLETESGTGPEGEYYVTEHQSDPVLTRGGVIPYTTTDFVPNQFNDLLMPNLLWGTRTSTQFFSISPSPDPRQPGGHTVILRRNNFDYGAHKIRMWREAGKFHYVINDRSAICPP